MRNRRLFIKVITVTSLFWLAVDVLYYLSVVNNQVNLFNAESFIPSSNVNTNGPEKRSRVEDDLKQRGRKYSKLEPYFTEVIQGLGENGEAATLPPRYNDEAEQVFDNHSFNVILSDHMSIDRTLKDVRGPK